MCAELVEFYDIKGFIVMISIAIGVAFTTWLLMKKLNSWKTNGSQKNDLNE